MVEASDNPLHYYYSCISAFREIYASGAIIRLLGFQEMKESICFQVDSFFRVLQNFLKYPIDYANIVICALSELIQNAKLLFGNQEIVNKTLSIAEDILPHSNAEVYQSIHDLFLSLVKAFYGKPFLNIEKIVLLTRYSLCCNNETFIQITLNFWFQVLSYEKALVEKNKQIERFNKARKNHVSPRDDKEYLCPEKTMDLAGYY